jgi:hypoxanthine phosphoribosyltransferase
MGGAVVFTGNLLPQLTFPLEFDYIHVSRYGDEDKGGEVVWKVVPRSNVAGRTVIVLDDILDEGETLAHVKQRLLDMGAKEVILAVFADKAIGKVKPVSRHRRHHHPEPLRGRLRHGCLWLLAQPAGPVGDQQS